MTRYRQVNIKRMHVEANTRVKLHQWADDDIYAAISMQDHTKRG